MTWMQYSSVVLFFTLIHTKICHIVVAYLSDIKPTEYSGNNGKLVFSLKMTNAVQASSTYAKNMKPVF